MNVTRRLDLLSPFFLLFLIFIAIFWSEPATKAAQRHASLTFTPAEQWVIQQTSVGKQADLAERFPLDQRKLRAAFLSCLLLNKISKVRIQRQGVRISHAVVSEPLNLEYGDITFPVWLDQSNFEGDVKLLKTHFHNDLTFDKTIIQGSANFRSMKVDGDFRSNHAIFIGPANFRYASISGGFEAQNAQFNDFGTSASFDMMTVAGPVDLYRNTFIGKATFFRAKFARIFGAEGSEFQNNANFTGLAVGEDADLDTCVFKDSVSFDNANIGSDLTLDGAQFESPIDEASFSSMTVGHIASIDDATFAGPANFRISHFDFLEATRAQFSSSTAQVSFSGMKVDWDANFDRATFKGPAEFSAVTTGYNFSTMGATFNNVSSGTNFKAMRIGDTGDFSKVTFFGPIYFNESTFSTLNLSSITWPKEDHAAHFKNTSYQHLLADEDNPTQHTLNVFNKKTAYDVTVYRALEDYFRRQGNPHLADNAFIDQKRRERKEGGLGWINWLWSWFTDILVGQGRIPEKALIPSVIVVVIGAIIFRHEQNMETQKSEDKTRLKGKYQSFWYSADLFIPVIGLESANIWIPIDPKSWRYQYMRMHKILGWLLVPLFVAAWTGLIK